MKKQGGFSLVQLMIVAGMLSGIFVVSLKIMKNQNQIGKSSSEEFEITYLFDDIRSLMADSSVCKATLELVSPYEPMELEGIKSDPDSNELNYQPFRLAGKKYGQSNIKIKSISYLVGDQEASIDDGEAFVKIVFEKSKSALGRKEVEKRMKLHLLLDNNKKISTCFSLPGINTEGESVSEVKDRWYDISGTPNIYTNEKKVQIGAVGRWSGEGVAVQGSLKIGSELGACHKEKVGSLRYEKNSLLICKKTGKWHEVWNPYRNVVVDDFNFATSGKDRVEVTKKPYHFCTITKSELYGARCLTKRLSGNLWQLSLYYDRGEKSKCTFRCFSKR
ncbi:MAG: hypothetical protein CME70_20395 [Halobacteriovorax sp.]|nr:hypothetical protein [Halobacteriovorax sp.]|tara:strand:- start:52130 stop:53128 length:999 start_codon:yes stop_codon:yes gene_type:complete